MTARQSGLRLDTFRGMRETAVGGYGGRSMPLLSPGVCAGVDGWWTPPRVTPPQPFSLHGNAELRSWSDAVVGVGGRCAVREAVREVMGELGKRGGRGTGHRAHVVADEILVAVRKHAVELRHVLGEPRLHAAPLQ